jgi:spore coat protein A, manganese oxidase
MGLAGMYIVEGEQERNLPLPRDERDVPLILQDRLFSAEGALLHRPDFVDGPITDTILVNGRPYPRMDVFACRYRFRILNASNASDGGLLAAPNLISNVPLAMAERTEVVIDFSAYPVNTRITLDDLNAPADARSILQFYVVRKVKDDSRVPERLAELHTISIDGGVRHRTFLFTRGNPENKEVQWSINGQQLDPTPGIAEINLGDIEVWRLTNHSFRENHNVVHPVHVQLVNFLVLQRNGGAALSHENGWKDTVALNVGDEVVIGMRFEKFKGRYLLHCHNLEHEDRGMIARFDIR